MADPLLTSLCTICHIQTPKYKCPRCGIRTCSLACVKKHKNWSSCNGERDATVFIPREQLKTDAGIDHDYNFITKIERSVERAEKILREEKSILPEETPNLHPNKRARLSKGRSRGRTTLGDSNHDNDHSRRWDRNAIHRLRQLGIRVTSVPYGMKRSKENETTWNKRTRTVNWQVEWLHFGADAHDKPTRMLHKLLDETPLYIGFSDSHEYYRRHSLSEEERTRERKVAKKQQEADRLAQNWKTSAWQAQPYCLQHHLNASWSKPMDGIQPQKDTHRFFFLKPITPSKDARVLVPLDSSKSLASLLPGLDIVEFPSICVLPLCMKTIPRGFAIEHRSKQPEKKRKSSTLVEHGSSDDSFSGKEEEEKGDGKATDENDPDDVTSDDATSSSGSDSDMSDLE
ncbi:hypothetical protein F5Y15DRAFT_179730 [Xylariaceae sp. FL0016]|nr:hypothetical protein F5Y15DRAFT_179730 [Xylariaceae sp. FL0016]